MFHSGFVQNMSAYTSNVNYWPWPCQRGPRRTGWSKKTDTRFYFWDNFGNSAPMLTILSL